VDGKSKDMSLSVQKSLVKKCGGWGEERELR
jgi:hypothetical protein